MATENLTTYVEVDPNSRFSVTQTRVTISGLLGSDSDHYVYKDFGVDYFSGDFTIDLTIRISSTAAVSGGILWCLANVIDSWMDLRNANESALAIELARGSDPPTNQLNIREADSGTVYTGATYNISVNTTYYLTVKRDEGIGTYGTIYLYIYSDAARTSLITSSSIALHTSKKDFRYHYAIMSQKYSGWTGAISGYVEDFEITNASVPAVTTQAVTAISGTTATGNGNITNLGYPNPTQHGHCWKAWVANDTPPTTADSKTQNGAASATGAFTSAMTGFVAGTRYRVRTYATNTAGTSYGYEVEFWANKGTVFPTDPLLRASGIKRSFWAGIGGNAIYQA